MLAELRTRAVAAALTVAATVLLLGLSVSLALLSYRRLEPLLPLSASPPAPGWVKTRTARAIRRARAVTPGASCLPQAIAGGLLLKMQGYGSVIRIGVAPAADRPFKAHAWLVCGKDVIVGDGGDLADFKPLTDLTKGAP